MRTGLRLPMLRPPADPVPVESIVIDGDGVLAVAHRATTTRKADMTSEDDLLSRVRQAWAGVLAVEDADSIPLDTNFLEIGGNSLLLVMLWEDLQEATSQILKVSDLFRHGTVRSQAALLAGGDVPAPEPAPVGAGARSQLLGRARRTPMTTGDASVG